MAAMKRTILILVTLSAAAAQMPSWGLEKTRPMEAVINSICPDCAPMTPQILKTFLEPNAINIGRNSYITRQGTTLRLNGEKWTASGANVYWLGLDENVIPPAGEPFYAPLNASYPTKARITEIMNVMTMMGIRLIRSQTLGISVGNPLSIMPSLGVYNEAAFDPIDWSVFQARQHGLRIVVPLIDNYDYYHGGKYNFLRWRGVNVTQSHQTIEVQEFYTNPQIVSDFKAYVKHLLTHRNPYTGLTYAEDPTIAMFETGNELSGPKFGDMDVPVQWTRDMARYIKSLAPHTLIVDGTYGVNKTHLAIPEIDIFSDHFYPLNLTKLNADIELVGGVDRVYLAGEIDWTEKSTRTNVTLRQFFDVIEARQSLKEPVVAGTSFWSLFGRDGPDCSRFVNHTEIYTLQYNNPLNTPKQTALISTIRQHNFKMMGIDVGPYLPEVPCSENYVPGFDAQYTT